jgi:HNH endonuclease
MTECINSWWTPSRSRPLYWDKTLKKRRRHSHLAWEDANQASLLPGAVIMHTCDNPRCINPKHLVLGTQAENIRDMMAKGRHFNQKKTTCPKGHPLTKYKKVRLCTTCKKEYDRTYYLQHRKQNHAPN